MSGTRTSGSPILAEGDALKLFVSLVGDGTDANLIFIPYPGATVDDPSNPGTMVAFDGSDDHYNAWDARYWTQLEASLGEPLIARRYTEALFGAITQLYNLTH